MTFEEFERRGRVRRAGRELRADRRRRRFDVMFCVGGVVLLVLVGWLAGTGWSV